MKVSKPARLFVLLGCCLALLAGAVASASAADQFTINCITAFPRSTHVSEFFINDFIGSVQKAAEAKYPGQLKIVFKGGPELVATNDQIMALEKGMVDLMYNTPGSYASKMPELDIMNMTTLKPWEEKAVGLNDYLDKLHNEKTNSHYLVRNGTGLTFQIGSNKMIKTVDDIKGMSLRGNPTTVQIVKALGASPVQMAPGDVYTALERGVVQGHITPAFMIRTLGLVKVTKYLLFPGFFDTPNVLLVNLNTWKKLPKHLQDLLTEEADAHSRRMWDFNKNLEKTELEFYKTQGMEFIELPKPEADKFMKIANDGLTQVAMEKAPNETKKIIEFLQKKP